MNYAEEFPEFILDVEIPAGFIDNSWHNNAMPCWVKELPDQHMLVLWIDYADQTKRDFPHNARFVVHITDIHMTDVYDNFATDDYAAALAWIDLKTGD
jgi:hypothetical protein